MKRAGTPRTLLAALVCVAAALAVGCGGEVSVPEDQQSARRGAELFNERCSGCHTLSAANSFGSKPEGDIQGGDRTNGPSFDQRKASREDVLFAIRNGGFSGAIMPANIVTGREADLVAEFVARYAGRQGGDGDVTGGGGQSR